MMENIFLVVGIAFLVFVYWYLANYHYFEISKTVKKTKNDVDECVNDMTKLKSDIKMLKDIVVTIDDKITEIEKRVK